MSVMAMKVVAVTTHPNADSLYLYTMEAPGKEKVQIIASLDSIYQVDDVVAIALVGSILKDGLKIKPSKLRGIYSYGMALGKVEVEESEAELAAANLTWKQVNKPLSDIARKWYAQKIKA
jgi:tRNA-binding EMAP/Myf-like protein